MKRLLTISAFRGLTAIAAFVLLCTSAQPAAAEVLVLHCDLAQTAADFTLDSTLHTVHGSFAVKRCEIQFDPASGKVSGEFVFDATSGHSGSDGRDKKMHKDVLESARYPEITFHLDRVEGPVAAQGTSTVQVHGQFGIHGAEHEITIPVEVKMNAGQWTATAHFTIPYAEWGMKNPSNFVLHVPSSVEIELHAGGGVMSAAN